MASQEDKQTRKDKKGLWLSVWKKQWIQRVSLIVALILSLATFLHFKEVHVDVPELNATSEKYVIAQVDFDFPDEEATGIWKNDVVKDLGYIYEIEEKEIRQKRYEFEGYLLHQSDWKSKAPKASFEDLYKAGDMLSDALSAARFTDLRTMQKVKEFNGKVDSYYLFTPKNQSKSYPLPKDIWDEIVAKAFPYGAVDTEVQFLVCSFFQSQEWNFVPDQTLNRSIRNNIQGKIAPRLTKVPVGSRIIEPGEKVNLRHIMMIQAMKEALAEKRNLWRPLTIISSLLLSIVFVVCGALFLFFLHPDTLKSLQKLSLLVIIVILSLAFAKVTEYVLVSLGVNLIEVLKYPIITPFIAILVSSLIGTEVALFSTLFLLVIIGTSLAVNHERFLLVNLVSGVVAIVSCREMRKRKEVLVVCLESWVAALPVILAFNLSDGQFFPIISDVFSAFVYTLFTSILIVGILPVLESVFNVMTDMTLMEYMDPSSELLRRLSIEAPGTYQHSLVVGNLSEAAAQAISANGLFCRVATLYHDIGKLFNPHYFTENQTAGFNIHQLLTPVESAQVIIEHVPAGEVLAKKYHLPKSFIDIIREHHGNTLVYFFYCKQIEKMEGDATKVDESAFRYPGPKPRSKESAIIMIADTVEAASRSLDEFNEETVTEMVEKAVVDKAEDGQFDECKLTFEELGIVKKAMIKTLLVTKHIRVKYPARH